MLTLRIISPSRFLRLAPRTQSSVLGLYYQKLWQSWHAGNRLLALITTGMYSIYLVVAFLRVRNLTLYKKFFDCWRYGFTPEEFRQAMMQIPDPTSLSGFIKMYERKGIHRLLNTASFPLSQNPLKNKVLFATKCREADLPIPPTLAHSKTDQPLDFDTFTQWLSSAKQIIFKPAIGSKGSGIHRFTLTHDGSWFSEKNKQTFNTKAFLQHINSALTKGAIIQHAVATHPLLSPLSPGALPTLRLVTCINESQQPEVVASVLRLSAHNDNSVDNFNRGNLAAYIDASGRTTAALMKGNGNELIEVTVHPATGAQIAGFAVPLLNDAEHLARTAHQHFSDKFNIIGWDIGLSADGPILIEGNWNHGTDIIQLASKTPIESTRLGELYSYHLMRLPESAWRTASPIQYDLP